MTKRPKRRANQIGDTPAPAEGNPGGQYRPLSDAEVTRIHRAALDVLARTGMAGPTPTVRDLALENGCTLDGDGRLLFPPGLVEDVLAGAARSFVMHGQDPRHDLEIRPEHVHFCTGGAAVKMLDHETRQYRDATVVDLYDLARLCDTLANIQWFTRTVVATEISDWYELDINTAYACAAGTSKHIGTSLTLGEHVEKLVAMFDVMLGGEGRFQKRPFHTAHATTIVSPLTFAEDSSNVATAAARHGMPILSLNGPQSGATAPAALAGTMVLSVAEALAALVAINLVQPGHPVIIGNATFVSDLRSGAFSGGGGEQAVLTAASAQMSNFYGIPSGVLAGMSDSKLPDNQAGYEKAITDLLAGFAGANFVYESAGMLAGLLGCSFEAMAVDDEMISNIRRAMRGIEVTDDTLSVEVIEQVARGPGHFLGAAQTLELMESEYVYPRLADRATPDEWRESGSTDIWDRARDRVTIILAEHYPDHIASDLDRRIREQFPIRLHSDHMAAGTGRWKVAG
ncbi:MAG: trimethylamine methyltransferase family protein [Pseudomonadota bacterium]|nr:trimethylamine methyltransferase family protein [Pseudomonadota bacterium]